MSTYISVETIQVISIHEEKPNRQGIHLGYRFEVCRCRIANLRPALELKNNLDYV